MVELFIYDATHSHASDTNILGISGLTGHKQTIVKYFHNTLHFIIIQTIIMYL